MEILESSHLPPPSCSDGLSTAFNVGSTPATKQVAIIYHDESTFNANDGHTVLWAKYGVVPIRPKSQGSVGSIWKHIGKDMLVVKMLKEQ